ncbi:MAG: OmpA family protein [Bacteroidales bacterium]|nr:OmpA family protein [Bacteroidales bacterium]
MKALFRFPLLIAIFLLPVASYGQIKVDFKKKVINQTNTRVNQATDKTISKSLDVVEDGITDAVTGGDEKDEDKNQNKADKSAADTQNDDNSAARSETATGSKSSAQEQPALQTYSKYDFTPGEKILFYEDFSQDAIGDFPALWNTNGSAEVVNTNLFPGNWMKFDCREAIWTDALLTLPDNYTIEFDVIPTSGGESNGGMSGYSFRLMQAINAAAYDHGAIPGKAAFCYSVEYFGRPGYRTYINLDGAEALGLSGTKEDDAIKVIKDKKYHIALWYQKGRVRFYQDQNKLFDLPKAFTFQGVKMDRIRFEDGAAMVTNIRIAVGAPDMRNKLLTEGKLVTYGIYFDVNKDVVKHESYGTLKSIATILTENPDVRVKIVGHTDSDGADAANLDLSKRRGASVKNELVKSFGIDASRLESDGMGETQPISPNDSPANKALNRRVELLKL